MRREALVSACDKRRSVDTAGGGSSTPFDPIVEIFFFIPARVIDTDQLRTRQCRRRPPRGHVAGHRV